MVSEDEVLDYLAETGSTWMPVDDLEPNGNLFYRTCNEKVYVTHPWYKEMEQKCSLLLVKKLQMNYLNDTSEIEGKIPDYIKEYEEANNIKLSDEQISGVHMICTSWIGILTGGPGTGKTSVLKCAKYVLQKLYGRLSFAFTAPTGKAARRITESTGFQASTIHRKIHDVGESEKPLKAIYDDYLFIDESSMLDLEIFTRVMLCLSNFTHIFFVGDVDQLPSVNEGAILRDLIDCGELPYTKLEKTFRQDNSSKLFENIQIIKKGCHVPLEEGNDFKCFRTEKDAFKLCVEEYMKNVKQYGLEQTVILSPYRKVGNVCSKKLNNYIQKVINPDSKGVKVRIRRDGEYETIEFRVGDPVIHLKNRKEIANGDCGKIIKADGDEVLVQYSDCIVRYVVSKGDLNDLDLAYALSVNKAQGSEYNCVIVPILREFENVDKSMIFTAVTRAKVRCEVIGLNSTIMQCCKTKSVDYRKTFLRDEIDISVKQLEILAAAVS